MKKILLIDDEKATLNMFRLLLGVYGYDVYVAENGQAGLEIIEKEKPSIVFTDIKMPGMDGFEVLKRIKQSYPETEVIVMTGHGDMELAVEALNLEATDFINKPIQRNALDAALKRAEERLKQSRQEENEIRIHKENGISVMEITGDLGSHSEQYLMASYEQFTADGADKILMCFNENVSINGAGIAVVIQVLTEGRKKGQTFAITGLSENFRKIFDMVGITNLARVFESKDAAFKEIAQWAVE